MADETPQNHVVVVDIELSEIRRDDRGVLAVAEGSLYVDGKRNYEGKASRSLCRAC